MRGSAPKGVVGREPEISSGEEELYAIEDCRTITVRPDAWSGCLHGSGESSGDTCSLPGGDGGKESGTDCCDDSGV
eukprot:2668112-Pleurochrysis_carterae.AAC.1